MNVAAPEQENRRKSACIQFQIVNCEIFRLVRGCHLCRTLRFFFELRKSHRLVVVIRCDDDLGKYFDDRLGDGGIDLAVKRDDAAESRNRVGRQGASVGFLVRRADADAGRICVLDDRDGEFVEVVDQIPRRFGIDVVVERHLLAVKLLGVRDAAAVCRCKARLFDAGFRRSGGR